MELVVQQPALGELVEVQCWQNASGRAHSTETDIIEKDDHDIRCILRRLHFEHRRRLGIPRIKCRDRRIPRSLEGELGAVDLCLLGHDIRCAQAGQHQ